MTVPSRGWELGQHPVECVLSNCTMGTFLFPNTARGWSDNDTDTILRCSLIDAHAYWLDDGEVKTFSRTIVRSTQFGFRVTNLLIFYVGFVLVSDVLLVSLHVMSWQPYWCWRTKAFLSFWNWTPFSCKLFELIFIVSEPWTACHVAANQEYATSTFPVIHLICPPKVCISIVFNFS